MLPPLVDVELVEKVEVVEEGEDPKFDDDGEVGEGAPLALMLIPIAALAEAELAGLGEAPARAMAACSRNCCRNKTSR